MAKNDPPSAADVLARLGAVRSENETATRGERVAALLRALQESLGDLPEDSRDAAVRQLRGLVLARVVSDATGDPARTSRPSAADPGSVESLESRSERERVALEVRRLREENRELTEEIASLRAAEGSPPTMPGRPGGIDRLREVLRRAVRGVRVSPEDSGLAGAEAQVLRLTAEMVRFILDLTKKRQLIMAELYSGPGGGMQTLLINQQNAQIRKLLLDIVEEKKDEGSIERLTQALRENDRFLLGMSSALTMGMPEALAEITKALDPETLLEKHRGRFSTNYEGAWKDFQRKQNDMANLSPLEIYETYFKKAVLAKFEEEGSNEGE